MRLTHARIRKIFFTFGSALLLVSCGASTGSSGGGGGTGGTVTTRDLTGTVSVGSLVSPSLAKGVHKTTQLACSDAKICCVSHTGGTPTVAALTAGSDSNCTFTETLTLGSFNFCGLFTGTDADNNGCPDTYLGSLGCSSGSTFAGQLPIFASASGSTTAIDGGTFTLSGHQVTASSDLCGQVDQDGDGVADASDTDADGDGVTDGTADEFDKDGFYRLADDIDTDSDGTPDIYEASWDDLPDADGDGIPNCAEEDMDNDGTANASDTDVDGDGTLNASDADSNGDGIDDTVDTDTDQDGLPNIFDDDIDGDGITNDLDDDIDGDGIANAEDTDADGNGILDAQEAVDTDQDGIPNYEDDDIDGDGIVNELDDDMDGDEIANADDTDADGDGVLDSSGETDTNGNGIPDIYDSTPVECTTVQDCSQLATSTYPDFSYSESVMTCSSAGNCEYDCAAHSQHLGGSIVECETVFTDAGQTCTDAYLCDMFAE